LFNIPSARAIQNASVRDQCAKDYLYGKDGHVEAALARLEGDYSTIIKRLSDGETLNEAALKEHPSRVTFALEAYGKLTKLTLTHEDFAEDSVVVDGISKGWPAIMCSLKSLLETGEPLLIPIEALFIAELEEVYRA